MLTIRKERNQERKKERKKEKESKKEKEKTTTSAAIKTCGQMKHLLSSLIWLLHNRLVFQIIFFIGREKYINRHTIEVGEQLVALVVGGQRGHAGMVQRANTLGAQCADEQLRHQLRHVACK